MCKLHTIQPGLCRVGGGGPQALLKSHAAFWRRNEGWSEEKMEASGLTGVFERGELI